MTTITDKGITIEGPRLPQAGSWAWCEKTDKNKYEHHMLFITCKDHMVDAYKLAPSHITSLLYIHKEVEKTCFIMTVSKEVYDNYNDALTNAIHPLDKKMGALKTVITPLGSAIIPAAHQWEKDKELYFLYVEGSKLWKKNALVLSFYLSAIRLLLNTKKPTEQSIYKLEAENKYYQKTPEYYYLQGFTKEQQILWKKSLDNLRKLNITSKYAKHGYPETRHVSHGNSGIFHVITNVNKQLATNRNNDLFINFHHVMEKAD